SIAFKPVERLNHRVCHSGACDGRGQNIRRRHLEPGSHELAQVGGLAADRVNLSRVGEIRDPHRLHLLRASPYLVELPSISVVVLSTQWPRKSRPVPTTHPPA